MTTAADAGRGRRPVGQRVRQHRDRAWRRLARRCNALRFFPVPVEQIVARLRSAGLPPRDAVETALRLSRRADDVVWDAALVGTPPHHDLTLDLDGFERLTGVRSWDRRPVATLLSALINAHIATHRSCLGDAGFWTRALAIMRRVGVPYLVIGDSHSICSCIVAGTARRPAIPIHVICTAGSAAGLDNPASRSGYSLELSSLARALRLAEGGCELPLLFQFGQVDAEFVSVFKRIARHETVFDRAQFERFCEQAVDAYVRFLTDTFSGLGALQVLSIFPPALADEAWVDGYTNAHVAMLEGERHAEELAVLVRSIAIPRLTERTSLHRYFNERLHAMCRARCLLFIDVFDRFIGNDGTIAARFNRFSGGYNHHLCIPAARKVIRPVVERIVGV